MNEVNRENVRAELAQLAAKSRDRFLREVAGSRVGEIRGASHDVLLGRRALVLQKMRAFLVPYAAASARVAPSGRPRDRGP